MASYTKKAIRDAFIKLLNERPLSQITVRDIVDTCGVNRNTFYYHYQDISALIDKLTGGMGADIVYECSGAKASIRLGMSLLKRMGSLVQIGLTAKDVEIEYSLLTARQIKLVGTFGHKWQSWDTAIKLMQQGKLNCDALITHRFNMDDWKEAFGVADRAEGIKVVIFPNK